MTIAQESYLNPFPLHMIYYEDRNLICPIVVKYEPNGNLTVDIRHFYGPLLGFSSDKLSLDDYGSTWVCHKYFPVGNQCLFKRKVKSNE